MEWEWVAGVAAGLVVVWVLLLAALWLVKPDEQRLRESLRLLPDVIRLLSRLARDRTVPLAARVWLWGLLAYLAMPIDVVPDFVPVPGYADDAILVLVALRAVVRRAGRSKLAEHWPGTPDGLEALERLAGIPAERPPEFQ